MPNEERHLKGVGVSPGVAISRVCLFNDRRHQAVKEVGPGAVVVEDEHIRLNGAIQKVREELHDLSRVVARRLGPAEAEIFTAQAMILEDQTLLARIKAAIGLSTSAALAVTRIMDEYEARLAELDSAHLRERATDIGEIKRRLLDALENTRPALQCTGQPHCRRGRDRIIVAVELTPTLTTAIDAQHVRGFVTEHGGPTSHAAILARALGIPAVTGIKGIHGWISCGTELLLDGDRGEVVVNPAPATVQAALQRAAVVAVQAEPPVPQLRVLANISAVHDAATARAAGAEGIGLYRTEFEFFAAGRFLSEDEQYARYAGVVRAMEGKPVTCRLLDIGGDKSAPFFDIPPEQNPYLGFRGARLLLKRPELWRDQARALVRAAAHGPVQVLYPMIVDVEQFRALRTAFLAAVADLPPQPLKHGVMLEVPSACLQARELLQEADFASIGTNDLIQYLFAVDRNNELVADDYRADRPVFWRLLADLAAAARELQRPLTVCGELAGEITYLPRLREAGVEAVSVSPRMIAAVRRAARRQG